MNSNFYIIQNIGVLVVLSLLTTLLVFACRSQFWIEAARKTFKNKRTIVSFAILTMYLTIGLLDSVSWRDVQLDADGVALLDDTGSPVLQARGRSLLDRLDHVTVNLGGHTEQTYSSPFSDQLFPSETKLDENGVNVRYHRELKHPGTHPMGTGMVGMDVMYMGIKGIHTALVIGGAATLIAVPFALMFGIMAGYRGGWVDELITYFYSTLASIPWVLLVIAFVLAFGQGLLQICLVLGLTSWVGLCRIVRGEAMKLREMDYVHAARATGASSFRIQFTHLLPNVMHLVVVRGVLMFSGLVLAEAVLSYLRVGVGPETASWGRMINQGRFELSREPIIWWNLVAALVFMFGLLLPANIFGDAVRDALDPRLAQTK